MLERVETRHPTPGKQGVNIAKHKYDTLRRTILSVLEDRGEVTFTELTYEVRHRIAATFEGSIPWYVTTVKLDLEARELIKRVPGSHPQRLRLMPDARDELAG